MPNCCAISSPNGKFFVILHHFLRTMADMSAQYQ